VHDPLGLVPPEIKARYQREEFVDRGVRAKHAVDRALKALDPNLECVFIGPRVPRHKLPPEAVAGRWHVRKHNKAPNAPSYIPILGPEGSYCDPDVGMDRWLAELASRDLRKPGVLEEVLRKTRADGGNPDKELEREQRRDELVVDLKAGKRVTGEGGLTKRKWGKA